MWPLSVTFLCAWFCGRVLGPLNTGECDTRPSSICSGSVATPPSFRAPYERTFPYQEASHDVVMELDKGLMSGSRGEQGWQDRVWKDYRGLSSKRVNRVTRLESQDGKRKKGTQPTMGEVRSTAIPWTFCRILISSGFKRKCRPTCRMKSRKACCEAWC